MYKHICVKTTFIGTHISTYTHILNFRLFIEYFLLLDNVLRSKTNLFFSNERCMRHIRDMSIGWVSLNQMDIVSRSTAGRYFSSGNRGVLQVIICIPQANSRHWFVGFVLKQLSLFQRIIKYYILINFEQVLAIEISVGLILFLGL